MSGIDTGFEGVRRRYDTAVFERRELDNGIPVWLQNPPILTNEQGVLQVFLMGIGGINDPKDAYGVAHFFEHIPLLGSKSKPSEELLLGPIKDLGATVRAFTSKFFTEYIITTPKDKLELACETMIEILTEPLLDEKHVETEKGVILNEYKRFFSNGDNYKGVILPELVLGKEHPAAHHVLGTTESIQRMSQKNIQEFHQKHYHSGNYQIICGGAFSEDSKNFEVISKYFGKFQKRESTFEEPDFSVSVRKNGERHDIVDPRISRDSLHIMYSFEPQGHDWEPVLSSLAYVLSGEKHSPLMNELRHKRGWVYESGLCEGSVNYRLWSFAATIPVDKDKFDETENIFYDVLGNLDEKTIKQAQKRKQLSRKLAYEDPYGACVSARGEIIDYGKPMTWKEFENKQDLLTIEEIFSWRDQLLNTKPLVVRISKN